MVSTAHEPPAAPAASFFDRIGIPSNLIWGYAGMLLFMIGDGVETSYLSTYFKTLYGWSESTVGVIFTTYGIAAAVGAFLAGGLSDRWGARKVMMIGAAIWAVCHAIMLAVAVPTGSYALILGTYGIRGLGYPLFAYGFLVWVMAGAPKQQISKALGWYWFSFTMGYPVLGSGVVSVLKPTIGHYPTLWVSLVLILAGAAIVFTLLKDRSGYEPLVPADKRPSLVGALVGSVTIMFEKPKVGMGAITRLINTTSQFGIWVFVPLYLISEVGYNSEEWSTLLMIMMGSNLAGVVGIGWLGDKFAGHKVIVWFGGVLCAVTAVSLYYVPAVFGHNYALMAVACALYGIGVAGYVPLPPMMTQHAPTRTGQVMATYTLGAGASQAVGPAIGTAFIGILGISGVLWIYAVLHLISAVLAVVIRKSSATEEEIAAAPADAVVAH